MTARDVQTRSEHFEADSIGGNGVPVPSVCPNIGSNTSGASGIVTAVTEQVTPSALPNGLNRQRRDPVTKRFLPLAAGEVGEATTHGLDAQAWPAELSALRDEVNAFLTASVADDGGESEVPTRRRSLHEYRARIHRRIVQLDAAIELRGQFDKKGKLRVAWVTKLESLISTARAIDNLLGLERRAKDVGDVAQAFAQMERRS